MSADRVLSAKVKSATQVKKPANARILTCLGGQVNVGKGQLPALSGDRFQARFGRNSSESLIPT